jgi:putative Ca2+/H+ antiporter (TMEM165/GDT1 family)
VWAVAAIAVTGGRWLGRVIDAFLIRVVTAVVLAGLGIYVAVAAIS